jgi:hypothetical protein
MHCEKNICENLLKTIFGEKDIVVVQMDLEEMTVILVTTSSQWRFIPETSCTICIDRGKEEDFLEDHHELETPISYVGTL